MIVTPRHVDDYTVAIGMLLIRVDSDCRIAGLYLATGGDNYVEAGVPDGNQRARARRWAPDQAERR